MSKKSTAAMEEAVAVALAESTSEETTEETAEVLQLVYVGPSIPRSGLRHGTILRNTQEEITAFLGKFSERYPEIKYLLVAPKDLPAAQKKVRTKGNILYKYYQDTAAKALTFRKGK